MLSSGSVIGQHYGPISRRKPPKPEALTFSLPYARVGRYAESLQLLESLLAQETADRRRLLRRVADVHLKQRSIDLAIKAVEAARKAEPGNHGKDEEIKLLSIRQVAALLKGDHNRVDSLAVEIEKAPTVSATVTSTIRPS